VRCRRECRACSAAERRSRACISITVGRATSRDLDFVCSERDSLRILASTLSETAASIGLVARLVRDAGTFVRATVEGLEHPLEIDLLYEATPPVAPAQRSAEGVTIASLEDMRASKLTCILSRSEPRDLVDLLFLDRAGHPPERDIDAALTKDGGVDPAILAWRPRRAVRPPCTARSVVTAPRKDAATRAHRRPRSSQSGPSQSSPSQILSTWACSRSPCRRVR